MPRQPNYGRNTIFNSYLNAVCDELDTWIDGAEEILSDEEPDEDAALAYSHMRREERLIHSTWQQF